MPPQTRTNGKLRLTALGPVNTSGLPAPPVELLHEIVFHLPCTPVPCLDWHVLSKDHLARSEAIRALSETCQQLRRVFLAHAWRHIEICASATISTLYKYKGRTWPAGQRHHIWSTNLAIELVSKLVWQTNVLNIDNPALAAEVRTVSVALSDSFADRVFPPFFRCLSLLPNSENLQIIFAPSQIQEQHLRSAHVAGGVFNFQSIRALVLHEHAFQLIEYCPNVERIYLQKFGFSDRFTSFQHLSKLRVLSSPPISAAKIAELVENCPSLVEMPPVELGSSRYPLTPDILRSLAKLRNLKRIDLVETDATGPDSMSLVAVAQKVLAAGSPDATEKYVTLKREDGMTYISVRVEKIGGRDASSIRFIEKSTSLALC